jgi:hypothetical protein
MRHVISGASDDIVQVDGPKGDEFNAYDGPGFLAFYPSGDVFRVEYDKRGVWRVSRVAEGQGLTVTTDAMDPAQDGEDDAGRYTDRVTVVGDVERVDYWSSWPPSGDEIQEAITAAIENGGVSDEQARRAWHALHEVT